MDGNDDAKILTITPNSLTDESLSPEVWVDRYARLHQIEYLYKSNSVTERGEPLEAGVFISQMRVYAHTQGMGEIKRMIPDAFSVWRRDQGKKYLKWLRDEYRFTPNDSDLIAEWVEAVTGVRNPLDVAVMRHFVWQVKRKIYGLPVEHHTMVALWGASGIGKSVAVHKLIEPLNDVAALRDMRVFNDQFARRAFTRSFIMFFDEMGKSNDVDIDLLKNIITANVTEWRGCGSESINSAPQNCTFIACTNLPLRERIKDPTSARRFYQLNCAEKVDWVKINSIDYSLLWKSIDEKSECPITSFLDDLKAVQQKEIVHQDLIESWLSNQCEAFEFNPDSPTTDELYCDFSFWCKLQCVFDFEGMQTFARGLQLRISSLKWAAGSKRSSRGTIWSVRLTATLPKDDLKRIVGLDREAHSEAVSLNTEPVPETIECKEIQDGNSNTEQE